MTVVGRVQLTGGGDAVLWRWGWAIINAESSPTPSSLLLQQSSDGESGTFRTPITGSDGTAVTAFSDATSQQMAMLAPGDYIKATGTGTLNVIPGNAPTFSSPNYS